MKQRIPEKSKKNNIPSTKSKKTTNKNYYWVLGVILALTLIAYIPSFNAEFVNWDDGDYAMYNPLVRSFSNFEKFFTTPVQGNFHPLTMISLAANYAISGSNASSYHIVNVILHLLNTYLVFRFIMLLSNGNEIAALLSSMLFGLHPMHVESVAWVSERKDVLYSFFFLLGLIYYIKYLNASSYKWFAVAIVFFLLSLLSKPAAIVFPAVLLIIDFYFKRKLDMKLILEKVPFAVFSAVFLYLAIHGQTTAGAVDSANNYGLIGRILFAFYGFAYYCFKFIFPFNIAPFYPFPPVNESLPVIFYFTPLFFVGVALLCLKTWKTNKLFTFGFGFYLINLILVLQFFVVGSAVVASRYTYLPYIGLFFILGIYLSKGKILTKTVNPIMVILIVGLLFTIVSFKQAETWKNDTALWENSIKTNPSATGYINRAKGLRKEGKTDQALKYYNIALKLNKADPYGYTGRGNIYADMGQDSLALKDYNSCLALRPENTNALDNRGVIYVKLGHPALALADFNKVLSLDANYEMSYKNRGVVLMDSGLTDEAIIDFNKYLTYDPKNDEVLNNLCVCYQTLNQYEKSLEPINKAIEYTQKAIYYVNRSYSYNAMGKKDLAKSDALTARNKGYPIDEKYARYLGI